MIHTVYFTLVKYKETHIFYSNDILDYTPIINADLHTSMIFHTLNTQKYPKYLILDILGTSFFMKIDHVHLSQYIYNLEVTS